MFVELLSLLLAPAAVEPQSEYRDDGIVKLHVAPPPSAPAVKPQDWAEQCKPWDDWDKPGPPFKVHGNTYYVGTCGITALFIKTDDGHVLMDTGTKKGAAEVYRNILELGFEPRRIGLILYSHEHFDHVGGLARIQKVSDAPVISSDGAWRTFLTGEAHTADPQYGLHDPMEPSPNVIKLSPNTPVVFGGVVFTAVPTPGHSPGAMSWSWEECENRADETLNCKTIVYADSLSPVSRDDYRFSDHPEYVAEYRAGIERLANLDCDILLTPHPSHSKMVKRAATGTFEGGVTCAEYAAGKMRDLDARLEREAGANQ